MAEGFNVNSFRAEVNRYNGILKNNKFLVRMYAPQGLAATTLANTVRSLEFWCESSNIPGVSLNTTEVRRYGYGNIEKKPYVSQNNDVTMSFFGDAQGIVWSYFQQWMRLIVNYDMRNGILGNTGILRNQAPFELAYKEQYGVDIHLYVFDDAGKVAIHVVLREAYPIFVGDIQLNWGDTNSLMRIPVTFTVYDWYNERISQGATFGPVRPDTIVNQTLNTAQQLAGTVQGGPGPAF